MPRQAITCDAQNDQKKANFCGALFLSFWRHCLYATIRARLHHPAKDRGGPARSTLRFHTLDRAHLRRLVVQPSIA